MPEIAGRNKREDEIAAGLVLVFARHVKQLEVGLAAPGLGTDVGAVLAPPLRNAFVDAARDTTEGLNIGIAGIERAADAWSATYGTALGGMLERQVFAKFGGHNFSADEATAELAALVRRERWSALAATEVTRAGTAGSEYGAAAWITLRGLLATTIWHTAEDEGVCPFCEPLDGLPRDQWQLYAAAGPPAHPNCRCWLQYSWLDV